MAKKQFKFDIGTRCDFGIKGGSLVVHGTIKRRFTDEEGEKLYHIHNPGSSNPVFTYVIVAESQIIATYKPVLVNKGSAKTAKKPTATKASSKLASKVA